MKENYQQTIDWLFSQVPMFQNIGAGAYKPGLDNVLRLSEAFGNPHKGLRTIHVGGTNGKGSVSSLIASVLKESGLKTGLFTSPHLVDFRERIRIDGQMISEEVVVEFIDRYRRMNLSIEPSFFELTTVMAFDVFKRNNVDIAVIEVGLGGRLDSTNIISPTLSVITNISFDHTAQLGNTLEAIAKEKAGIIKRSTPVVIGRAENEVRKVFADKADESDAPIVFASETSLYSECIKTTSHNIYKDTPWGEIRCELTGDCQPENAATVMAALNELGKMVHLEPHTVGRGFENVCINTGLIGRWTTLSRKPRVICDTGHNSGGWEWLGKQLEAIANESHLHIVAGFVNDKDIGAILRKMPHKAAYYWATPSVARGRDSEEVRRAALEFGISGEAFPTVEEAVTTALKCATEKDTIFIGGSNFIVADLLKTAIFPYSN